jgi:putative transposase
MREQMPTGNLYHIVSRGVDKRKIFLDEEDHFRFIHDLFEFNDAAPVNNAAYFFNSRQKSKDIGSPYIQNERHKRKLLTEILAFCLMPNHYHLFLRPRSDNGISKFMQKVNIGYAKYFNEKYERTGALFEGRYKSIHIKTEGHFIYLPYYIHFNPLDLKFPEWRQKSLKDYEGAFSFLEQYRWSSFLDYIGKRNFPSVTQRDFLSNFFDGPKHYREASIKWLRQNDLRAISDFLLENPNIPT